MVVDIGLVVDVDVEFKSKETGLILLILWMDLKMKSYAFQKKFLIKKQLLQGVPG